VDRLRVIAEEARALIAAAAARGGPPAAPLDTQFLSFYRPIFCLESVHALGHSPELLEVMRQLANGSVLVHPRCIVRVVHPRIDAFRTKPHQDYRSTGGTRRTFTAWIPLSDCPPSLGGLQVVPGTHRLGLLPVSYVPGALGGVVSQDFDDAWAGGDYAAGDVLVFHSLLVHRALPNGSDEVRLSVDFRYQAEGLPIHPGCFSISYLSLDWDRVYAGWKKDDLQFYWRSQRLDLRPSAADLLRQAGSENPQERELAETLLTVLRLARI
jgi:hypothetical protein